MSHKRVLSEGGCLAEKLRAFAGRNTDLDDTETKPQTKATSLSHSLSISTVPFLDTSMKPSKAYADAMKSLQLKIKRLEKDRDEAREAAVRLDRRINGSIDASEVVYKRETHPNAREKSDFPTQFHISDQGVLAEVNRATKSLRENIQELSEALIQIKAECREKSAKLAVAEEKCEKVSSLNRDLLRQNSDWKAKCCQLEESLSAVTTEKRGLVSVSLYSDVTTKAQKLEASNEILSQRLKLQEEFCEGQMKQIECLRTQVRELRKLQLRNAPASRVVSFPHSPAEAPTPQLHSNLRRTNSQKSNLTSFPVSPEPSFSEAPVAKLKKEIKRYQSERNRLEISMKDDRHSKAELSALKKLIRTKSRRLRQLSL